MSAAVEVAHAATGMPIIGPDGIPLPDKYPRNRPLIIWCIGKGQDHIASPIYRSLFQSGMFKVIKDLETKEWRAFRPWDPEDVARDGETKSAGPLIPERYIDQKGWAWDSKAAHIFKTCRLKNGNEVWAFTSNADPKQGDPVDLIWIDEDIERQEHVSEWQARLSDRKGRLIWSAFPHSQNEALIRMSERAAEQADRENPDVEEFVLRFTDNPFIDDDEKRKRFEGWDEDERRARDSGEFLTDNVLMYPNFNINVHGVPNRLIEERDELDKKIEELGNQIPNTWTRYIGIDPGHTRSAALFLAVPPEEYGDYVVVYDEVYLKHGHADEFAERIYQKSPGHTFEQFVIDFRASRQTPMGFAGQTIKQQYSDAFRKKRVESFKTGHSFTNGSDNVLAGLGIVRSWLSIRESGRPKLRVVEATTPNFQREMKKYKKRVTKSEATDEPVGGNDHLVDCLRYLACINPQYVYPRADSRHASAAYWEAQEWLKDADKRPSYVNLGPGGVS